MIALQRSSFDRFLQADRAPEEREDSGLQGVFRSVFPIRNRAGTAVLEFVSYRLERPKHEVQECRRRGMTYAAPVRLVLRLVTWDEQDGGGRVLRDVKEQEVFFGEMPLMTEEGTFVISGTERVMVSQLHRSPGAFYSHDGGRNHASGRVLHSCRLIPYRGSWLDFEFDTKDMIQLRIDRRRRMPATVLLRALGMSELELLRTFYDVEVIHFHDDGSYSAELPLPLLEGRRARLDVKDPETGRVVVRAGRRFTRRLLREMAELGVVRIPLAPSDLNEAVSVEEVVDPATGELLVDVNEELNEEKVAGMRAAGYRSLAVLFLEPNGPYLRRTLLADRLSSPEEAVIDLYLRLRPGEPPELEAAQRLLHNLFFNPERYDLSPVGRLKLNHKLGHARRAPPEFAERGWAAGPPTDYTVLTRTDIIEAVRYLIDLRNGRPGKTIDDIDHLGNRRVRAVGELLENQYRIGLTRMARTVHERMSTAEVETMMPHDLANARPVIGALMEYLSSSQLSQFMDQTNPLADVTHKRRLSALGPGGLTRERAGFEVRDVHATHYGRICPIETPEGPNIGLISSLTTYARVNELGFVETPYRTVRNGQVTDEVRFYSALEEEPYVIAQANSRLEEDGRLADELIACRCGGEFLLARPEEVQLIDVSPDQLVSVAAGLIPFLENDDANRALMGSNMQRQAVPLVQPHAPLVGTGLEGVVARDSGATVVARHAGVVEHADATRIVVRADADAGGGELGVRVDIYDLAAFERSNQSTCIHQRPIVQAGQRVAKGEVLADGPATDQGELALGQDVLVAFMPWEGFNFEDAVLVSERLVRDDVYTSIHIEELECQARETKLGAEEITRDIPNIGEEALADLDASGIVRIGADVEPGAILVGKITPKGDSELSPEEKLLRAIFGEKAHDVRDTSLRLPPGMAGTVIDVRLFTRREEPKDERARAVEDQQEAKLLRDQYEEIRILRSVALDRIRELLVGRVAAAKLVDEAGRELLARGEVISPGALARVPQRLWGEITLQGDAEAERRVRGMLAALAQQVRAIKELFQERITRLHKGDDLPTGVIRSVKVRVAVKRKLSVGDKLAGRHGNKGVVSVTLPVEDMPYLADGTPVDVVLNPLGVPSRMNVGQILETHLGWAARELGARLQELLERHATAETLRRLLRAVCHVPEQIGFLQDASAAELRRLARSLVQGVRLASPVFDGAQEDDIRELLARAGLPVSGQTVLFDGRSGEPFAGDVTVGSMYILKLHHLVEDKIHARSIGPYSLVTQQPLGGRAQFGGQRLGEMEVWAIEAYGAAYTLQEFLTVKSDDVQGRTRAYESIIRGDNLLEPGLPESFRVLLKEMQALGLGVELLEEEQVAAAAEPEPERRRKTG